MVCISFPQLAMVQLIGSTLAGSDTSDIALQYKTRNFGNFRLSNLQKDDTVERSKQKYTAGARDAPAVRR